MIRFELGSHQIVLNFALLLGLIAPLYASSAQACLSCSCGSSGSASDFGTLGAGASLFSGGRQWLMQSALSAQAITGSFNESGIWNPRPNNSSLLNLAGSLSAIYFPSQNLSLGLSLPLQLNVLDQVSWGTFGSLTPTDQGKTSGWGLADIQMQASYTLWEGAQTGVSIWSNISLPTGSIQPDQPAQTTGSGIPTLSAGLLGLYRSKPNFRPLEQDFAQWLTSRDWEALLNLGYAQALGTPPLQASPFFVGQSLLYQAQGNLTLTPQWTLGLGLNGQAGLWSSGQNRWQPASRIKLQPSIQYALNMNQGLRLALGADLPFLGVNQLSSISGNLVYYHFFD